MFFRAHCRRVMEAFDRATRRVRACPFLSSCEYRLRRVRWRACHSSRLRSILHRSRTGWRPPPPSSWDAVDCHPSKKRARLRKAGSWVLGTNSFEIQHADWEALEEDRSSRQRLAIAALSDHSVFAESLRISFSRRALPVRPRKKYNFARRTSA